MKLVIENLSKQYQRDFWGLRDFSIEFSPGILGLLGPNGAGKSTFMCMLATITKPTDGKILWNDVDIVKSPDTLRDVLGYLPQDFGVYPNLNAIEFLEYMAAIKGLSAQSAKKRIDELLQLVNLKDAAKRPLGGYSGGMKQRVGIAQALLNDPQLLIVDEPAVGLAPEWMSEKALAIGVYAAASGAYVIFGIDSPVGASDEVVRVMTETWEKVLGGKMEFVTSDEEMLAKTLAHIDAKRAALGLPTYDPKKFGRSGDWRVTELYERAVSAEALYGGN